MKVVLIAYSCAPGQGSEPGIGWNYVYELAHKEIELTVVTRRNNREEIERFGLRNVNFIYFDLNKTFLRMKKVLPFGLHLYIRLWQKKVYKNVIRGFKVDIVHHLNLVAFWNFPQFNLLNARRIVWGPVGMSDTLPSQHLRDLRIADVFNEVILKLILKVNYYRFSKSKRLCDGLLLRNRKSETFFAKRLSSFRHVLCETGIRRSEIGLAKTIDNDSLQIICVGRMVYWKGFILALKAFNKFIIDGGDGYLTIIGQGPQLDYIRAYIVENNLNSRVKLLKSVSRETVLSYLRKSHIMLHPSFRDGAPFAVLEAMSNGVVPIILNSLGPSDLVSDSAGIVLDRNKSQAEIVENISQSLFDILDNPTLFAMKSKNAVNRARNWYTWESHGENLYQFYLKSLDL